nr:hypothetical protein [Tanacetum cinerariifolium]
MRTTSKIGNSNYRLSTTFMPKEPTFQVALDVLSLTPFYQAFLISTSVLAIYMLELWAIATYQKHHIKFKINKKSYSFDLETFRDMFQICPKIPGQKSKLKFYLNHGGHLEQSSTNVSVIFLSIENKVSKRNKDMYYPRFTKIIINHFMSQDLSIPRRNKVDWHMASDDPILTTMRYIPQHEVIQKYDAFLPDNLTNQSMKESKAYKTYYAFPTGEAIPKPKYVRRSVKEKTKQVPKASSDKRIKSTAKMKLDIERSKTQLHSSQPSGSGALEGTCVSPGVPNVPTYRSDGEQISWKSSDEEYDNDDTNVIKVKDDDDQEDDNDQEDNDDQDNDDAQDNDDDQGDDDERTDLDNDGDDFVHPKFSTHDKEEKEEHSFDPRSSSVSSGFVSSKLNPSPDTVPTPATVPRSSLQDLPNFGSLFGFNHRLKALEDDFLEFKQTNQFVEAVSSIPGIVDTFLANKMNEAIKTVVQKNLYKELVDAYESEKLILDTYGDTVMIKKRRGDQDEDEEPFAGSNRGSKRRKAGKKPESTSTPKEKTSKSTGKSKEGSKSHQDHTDKSTKAEEPIHADE